MTPTTLLIGTYTQSLPHVDGKAAGILSATLDDFGVSDAVLIAETTNPSWIVSSPSENILYAVSETTMFEGRPSGGVVSYRQRPNRAGWTSVARVSSEGSEPAHLALHPNGRWLIVANFGSGSLAVIPCREGGNLDKASCIVHLEGSGPDRARQTSPHPHQIVFDPITGFVLVPDLGADALRFFELDDSAGTLTERRELNYSSEPGSGPRHLAFHPDGHHLFLLNEISNSLDVLRRDEDRFVRVSQVSTLPPGYDGPNRLAAIQVNPSGTMVLVSNRGHDSIAVFAFDTDRSGITAVSWEPSAGTHPRDIRLSANGTRLLVANQNSDSVALFEVDQDRMTLRHRCTSHAFTPVCLSLT